MYTNLTRGYTTLHRSLLDTQHAVFKVRTSRDAKIALLSVPSNYKAASYEITIGAQENTVTILKCRSPSGDVAFEVGTPSILSADELRHFWVQWINGTIEFGKGDIVGVSRQLKFTDPDPTYRKHILSLAVASMSEEMAEWELGNAFDTSKRDFMDFCSSYCNFILKFSNYV